MEPGADPAGAEPSSLLTSAVRPFVGAWASLDRGWQASIAGGLVVVVAATL